LVDCGRNYCYKLIPLMLIGTLFTALLSIFPKRSTTYYLSLQSTSYFNNCFFSRNYIISTPVLFEIY
jgi:hypothetical protein